MESHDAAAALADVHATRRRLADRAVSTRWYRLALGLTTAGVFVMIVVGPTLGYAWAAIVSALVPQALAWLLARVTGVSVERYGTVPGTRRPYLWYLSAYCVLLLAGLVLVLGLQITWAAVAVAGAMFVLVQVMELRIDAALRRGLAA